jgi:hypothetical protein
MARRAAKLLALLALTAVPAACGPADADSDQSSPTTPTTPVLSQPMPATGGPALVQAQGTASCTDPAGDVKGPDLVSVRVSGDGHRLEVTFELAALPSKGYLRFGPISGADQAAIFQGTLVNSKISKQFFWVLGQRPVYVTDAAIAGSTVTLGFPAESLQAFQSTWQWNAQVGTEANQPTDTCPDPMKGVGGVKFPG